MIDTTPLIKAFDRLGWSQQHLAIVAGLNENTISRFLHGDSMTMRTLDAIAGALGFEISFTIKEAEA